ncbi:hypothetical protein [Jannaschia sp. LMIT008]|uniref:hypothetical protein n=1 Tax=Jannaschia maritima TaxID=3032585 RepID=UPI0028117A16|nr:hypothetical protein [Jannaschia sp. LMIT008]
MADIPWVLAVGITETMARRLEDAQASQRDFRLLETNDPNEAISILRDLAPRVVVIGLDMRNASPLAIADYIEFRMPEVRVIYEMGLRHNFADGSIFSHSHNAHALVTPAMASGDLGAMVAHHALSRAA